MRKAIACVRQTLPHQLTWATAFAEGLRRHGWDAQLSTSDGDGDLLVIWGVRRSDVIARHLERGGEVCVIETGYLLDRKTWSSVSFGGGLNGRGIYRGPLADPSRWNAHFAQLLQPWRRPAGRHALLLGQVDGDMSIAGVNIGTFYNDAYAQLTARGWDVRFRPHPKGGRGSYGLPTVAHDQPLLQQLRAFDIAVTFNSNSATDAVLAGVPAITRDQGAMAWPVTGHDWNLPPMPDRDAWAHAMAWKQWTLDEMASGDCWDAVGGERCEPEHSTAA